MIVAKLLTKILKEGGVILIDHTGQKYICGNPDNKKAMTLKILKKNLNLKLILDPEIEFPEAYMRNEIIVENANRTTAIANTNGNQLKPVANAADVNDTPELPSTVAIAVPASFNM